MFSRRHHHVLPRAARLLALFSLLLLEGCAPAIVAGVAILLGQKEGGSGCTISGSPVEVTLQGTIRYQKRLDSQTGAKGMVPVRNGKVEVLRVNCGEKVVASTSTDDLGLYSVTLTIQSGAVLQVSTVTELMDPSSGKVMASVRNDDRERLIYSFEGAKVHLTPEAAQAVPVDLDVPIDCTEGVAGAFNLLEQARIGLETMAGTFPPPERPLTILWELGQPDGTFFSLSSRDLDGDGDSGDPFIQLRGGLLRRSECQNTDQFDDGVVLHEFGHYVAFLHSRDDSPGGPHSLAELIDPRLSWSEGWANFFSSMARDDPVLEDTCEDLANCNWPCAGSCGFEFSNDDPGAICTDRIPAECCRGIGSEDAVGTFLWRLFNPTRPGDSVQISPESILQALEKLKTQADPAKRHFFVYIGDYIQEIEDREPGQAGGIIALAQGLQLADGAGSPFPFPDRFPVESSGGNSVHASTLGTPESVNGCDGQACKVFAESFIGSSDFYRLDIPGSAGVGGTLTATLDVSQISSCNPDLELRIYNPAQILVFTARIAQPGSPRSISFSLDSSFPRGSPFLFEVAGDIPAPGTDGSPGNVGEKASYVLTVDVR